MQRDVPVHPEDGDQQGDPEEGGGQRRPPGDAQLALGEGRETAHELQPAAAMAHDQGEHGRAERQAADREDAHRDVVVVQGLGMVQPRPEHRGRHSAVFGCPEHDDRVRVAMRVLAGDVPDVRRSEADVARDQDEQSEQDTPGPLEPGKRRQRLSLPADSTAARPASRRATGTRNGEADT